MPMMRLPQKLSANAGGEQTQLFPTHRPCRHQVSISVLLRLLNVPNKKPKLFDRITHDHSAALAGASPHTHDRTPRYRIATHPYAISEAWLHASDRLTVQYDYAEPRRAAVALIIRVVPPPNYPLPPTPSGDSKLSLPEFFAQDWVSHPYAEPEILFLHRENAAASPAVDPNASSDAAVAFPGGRTEADDEDGLFTAMRHTWEEIGIDLAENDYMSIGQLDDREITTSLGKRACIVVFYFSMSLRQRCLQACS